MKNIKDITISIFAIIGFVAILSSFNNQTHDTVPESHEWEVRMSIAGGTSSSNIIFNKKTGEVKAITYDGKSIRTPQPK